MFEIGVFHNGASSLPVVLTKDGVAVNDGSLAEVHAAAQEVMINQVRQGILAEKLGFQSFWLTEHHFQPEGAEMSPNPLFTQMAIASQTKKIRLGQCANIVVWHHPVRIAEQIAQLDVISGGRVECGMGRGYQPRENETLGRPYGSTIQDQERNRKSFEEAVAIIQKCWTRAIIFASRREFLHSADLYQVEPQADHRLFRHGQGRAAAGGRDRDRRAGHVFRRQSGAGDDDDLEGAAGLSAAGAEAASADLGTGDEFPLAEMGGGAWRQRRDDRRAE